MMLLFVIPLFMYCTVGSVIRSEKFKNPDPGSGVKNFRIRNIIPDLQHWDAGMRCV
jgi:hypothetical protein